MKSFLLLPFFVLALLAIVPDYLDIDALEKYTYDQYLIDFGKSVNPGTIEYTMRKLLFRARVNEVIQHNQKQEKTWTLAVNKFSDRTERELKALRGGKMAHKSRKMLDNLNVNNTVPNAPINIDWRTKGVITAVKDQGMCGSCWSFATAETLESYWALAKKPLVVLSEQQILDCTPNPNDCGGTGGCEGGTVELAYARIIVMGGLSLESVYPYQGVDESCDMSEVQPVAKLSSYVNLPSNKEFPMLNQLVNNGPIAISVDASSWSSYGGGVYDGCDQTNPDLDHAVQLVGAGTDPQYGDYWLVRNSWGESWGEDGYIRLRRTSQLRCGTDTSPQDGDGCNGGPSQVTVCGTCGILYDGVYPVVSP